MNNKKVLYLSQGALIAALYIVINYAQEMLLPGSTTAMIQVRLSEVLCLMCVFSPAAVAGVTVGCFVANIISIGVLPLDMIIGTTATLIAALCSYKFRNIRIKGLPVLSSLMPVIANGIIIGLELEIFYVEGSFHIISFLMQAGCVAAGEFIACVIIGLPFVKLIEKLNLFNKLN